MLTLYHTNDFHHHLEMAQAHRLRHFRESDPEQTLLLDAGDAGGSGNITYRAAGEPILDLMSDAGYDAMTVGNRDFHFSKTGFEAKLRRARFPILCANVRRSNQVEPSETLEANFSAENPVTKDNSGLPTTPYIIKEIPTVGRVLIFGLTVPMITERMLSRKVSAYVFTNPIQTAAEMLPKWRETLRPDLVIALTHIGISQDRLLAETVPDIDLIVGGHTHVVLEKGEMVEKTLLVQAGSHGRFFGRVTIEREVDGWRMDAGLETL